MKDWSKKGLTEHPVGSDIDIDNIDQKIFDDPLLLLDYIEKEENKKEKYKSSTVETSEPVNHKKQRNFDLVLQSNPCNKRGRTIYGYERMHGKIIINTSAAEAIREIIRMYDKRYTIQQITDELKKSKYRTSSGKKFYPLAVQTIIQNRKIYEGKTGYPPIIQQITWETKTKEYSTKRNEKPVNEPVDYSEIMMKRIREKWDTPLSETKKNDYANNTQYNAIDEFIVMLRERGAVVIDNRTINGCVWVQADVKINNIVKNARINGRRFMYTEKSRTLGGKPGWYY